MYISSIAHVLSISGYHMALVAGIAFFVLRALLALLPVFASRCPIKKWAAFAALAAAGFYLLLSGAEVATQRSFIMVAIVLIGVMVDRPTLTFRTLTVAALGVLLLAPEAVVHPSFQMSFAATLALVAGYQGGLPWMSRARETPLGVRIALWGGREIVGLVLVSLLAGTATIPFIAYHFHRISAYGLLANLLAMPLVSAWVMPAGIARPGHHAVRHRRVLLAPHGPRHRVDGGGCALGFELPGSARALGGVRLRSAASMRVRAGRVVPAQDAAAVHRRFADRHCGRADDPRAAARCADCCRRQRGCGARAWTAGSRW